MPRSTAVTAGTGRTTAGTAPAGPRAERSTGSSPATTRRTSSGPAGGVTRPSMADVPGRPKTQRTGGTGSDRAGVGAGGWAGYTKAKAERSTKYPTLDINTDPVTIRFAEPEPFAFIYRHWVDKRPYTCIGEECPLCLAGHRAKPVVFYNVITVSDCVLRVWELTAEPTGKVKKQYDRLAGQDKTLDDPDLYFVVSKAKKDNGFFEYDVDKVRASDLEDECRLEPLTDGEIADAMKRGPFTDEIIYVSTKSDLRDAAEKMTDDDD